MHELKKTRRSRVIALMNAVSDLHEGDLLAVLKLDQVTPMREFGENDRFTVDDGRVIHLPGFPPPRKSLKHRAHTGKHLARILEQHLMWVLTFGEVSLVSYQKRRRKNELGGRGFWAKPDAAPNKSSSPAIRPFRPRRGAMPRRTFGRKPGRATACST
jgi:hypothetical protein